ncbi:MAG: hypothetical protein H6713_32625 [Myxococcales bacterium]|nr:hypothetical protein [Myxococcales bacterium]MCB9754707.1 hypothetical protein [Myxococcales bacterium]
MRTQHNTLIPLLLAGLCAAALPACDAPDEPDDADALLPDDVDARFVNINAGAYQHHLDRFAVRFNNPVQPGADAELGRGQFGLAADLNTIDDALALFTGPSQLYGGAVPSNGRSCASCHRGVDVNFALPPTPLTDNGVGLDDPLFTGIAADAGDDPDALDNLNALGLSKYRFNRFDPRIGDDNPFKQVFGWRKTPHLINIGLSNGFLNDGRGRVMFETARGAAFTHTQNTDNRFDDLFVNPDLSSDGTFNNMEAFMFETLAFYSDPALKELRDPGSASYDALASDPFLTVDLDQGAPSWQLKHKRLKGKKVFIEKCMSCHDTPNVFNSMANVEPLGPGSRPVEFPAFAPSVGRTFNVGVAEANALGLRFTRYDGVDEEGEPVFGTIVIPLANEDGSRTDHAVSFDIGLAATTGRSEDIGRFKSPQLRNIKDLGPYFHDNSIDTLEGVIDYFNSDAYNDSKDGKLRPIHLSASQRANLLEFLKVL